MFNSPWNPDRFHQAAGSIRTSDVLMGLVSDLNEGRFEGIHVSLQLRLTHGGG